MEIWEISWGPWDRAGEARGGRIAKECWIWTFGCWMVMRQRRGFPGSRSVGAPLIISRKACVAVLCQFGSRAQEFLLLPFVVGGYMCVSQHQPCVEFSWFNIRRSFYLWNSVRRDPLIRPIYSTRCAHPALHMMRGNGKIMLPAAPTKGRPITERTSFPLFDSTFLGVGRAGAGAGDVAFVGEESGICGQWGRALPM